MKKEKLKSIQGKTVFVVYIAVGNLSDADVKPYVKKISDNIKKEFEKFDDVLAFYIPTRIGDSRIEIIK